MSLLGKTTLREEKLKNPYLVQRQWADARREGKQREGGGKIRTLFTKMKTCKTVKPADFQCWCGWVNAHYSTKRMVASACPVFTKLVKWEGTHTYEHWESQKKVHYGKTLRGRAGWTLWDAKKITLFLAHEIIQVLGTSWNHWGRVWGWVVFV